MDGVVGIASRGFVSGGRVQALQKLPHVVVPPLSLAAMLPVTLLFRVETVVPVQRSVCPSALRMACNARGPAPDLCAVYLYYVRNVVLVHEFLCSARAPADEVRPQLVVVQRLLVGVECVAGVFLCAGLL